MPGNAVDNNPNTNFNSGFCTHTDPYSSDEFSWWQVDLADFYDVFSVVITNRGDCCGE